MPKQFHVILKTSTPAVSKINTSPILSDQCSIKMLIYAPSVCSGKSTLMKSYVAGSFTTDHTSTIGVDFHIKTILLCNTAIKLQIFDVSAHGRFSRFGSYLRDIGLVLICFPLFEREDFYSRMDECVATVREHTDAPIVFASTQADRNRPEEVTEEECYELVNRHNGLGYFKTSSKTGLNVQNVFEFSAKQVYFRWLYQQSNFESELAPSERNVEGRTGIGETLKGLSKKLPFFKSRSESHHHEKGKLYRKPSLNK